MKKLLYIFALACTAQACSKSDLPVGGGYPADGVVRISPTVAVPLTRAEVSTEFSGSRLDLGLYYGDNDQYSKTVLWKKDADGNWNSSSQLLWKNAEDEVVVYAYVPDGSGSGYDQGIIAPSGGIPSDQSAGLEDADWLWYSKIIKPGEALGADGKLNVQMNHALLKLTVKLSFGDEFGDTSPEIKEVWLNGTMQKVYVYYKYESRGQFAIPTSQSPMDIKMHKASDNCYEAIFYPSTGQKSGEKMLTVVLKDGRDYTLTLTEDLGFDKNPSDGMYLGGCAYSMTVKVGKDKLQMGAVTVASWNDKSVGDNFFTDAAEYSEWGGPEDIATVYAGGTGTSEDPYQIATAAQLAFLAQKVRGGATYKSTYFKLTGNIDLMSYEWMPIGNGSHSFAGIFDGDCKTILNLRVTKGMYAGLFGFAEESAEIKNLTIRNACVKSEVIDEKDTGGSGIVVGWCKGSSISDCSVEGISTGDCYVGGIVGRIESGKISDCSAEVSCMAQSGTYSSCGGIAGYSEAATIENCTVRGEVKGTLDAGGFVGTMEGGAIKRTKRDDPLYCYADVSLYEVCKPSSGYTETYNVGGLVGNCRGSSSSITLNIPVAGKVSLASGLDIYGGVVNLGGYTGYAENTQISGNFEGSIEAGTPTDGTLNAGAFIGWLGAGVTASYCKYYSSKVGELPIYGAKADSADDSGLKITTFD